MKKLTWIFAIVTVCACPWVSEAQATRATSSDGRAVAITQVRRVSVQPDSVRQRLGVGTILVTVRPVDQPTGRLEGFAVELRSAKDSLLSTHGEQSNGVAVIDNVPAGTYVLVTKRIAYQFIRFTPVIVTAGCKIEIEAYLRAADVDYYPDRPPGAPRTPGRATITTCATP